MARFEYFEPSHLDELHDLLARYGEDARVIAGGQSLLIMMRQGLLRPAVLISPDKISALNVILQQGNEMILGAMATQTQIAQEEKIRRHFPLLAQAASKVGSVHVQNLGTVGGNLCHAEPNGDSAPALLAAGASVRASGKRGERTIPLEEFFRGPFENALEPDQALTHIHVPIPAEGATSVYLKHVLRAVDRATVSVGVMVQVDNGGRCREIRIGLGGAAPTPIRAKQAEALLRDEKITESAIEAASVEVSKNCDPLSDAHGPADYKRKMAGLLTKRALRQALQARPA